MPKRCVIYVRVSTDAQEREGTSLETQEEACSKYAEQVGWIVVETFREAASGYSLERTRLTRARQLLQNGQADALLAYAVDRL